MNRRGFLGAVAAMGMTVSLVPREPEPQHACMDDIDDGQWMTVVVSDQDGRVIHQLLRRVQWTMSRDGVMAIKLGNA